MVTRENRHDENLSQGERFKQAAKDLEADEDEKRWEERLRKVAKAKPEKSD